MNIVFDLGAVLFRFEPVSLVARLWPERAPDVAAARALARRIFGAQWLEFDRGMVDEVEVADRVAEAVGVDVARMRQLVQAVGDELWPIDASFALVQRLRAAGHRLFYLSNMPAPYARQLGARAEMAAFEGGVFSSAVQQIKPEAAIFETLARQHRLDGAVTLFVDDSLVNVEAARGVGWQAFQFVDPQQCAHEFNQRLGDHLLR